MKEKRRLILCYNYLMNQKNILIWSGSIIITFILLFFVYKLINNDTPPQVTEVKEINIVRESDNIKWSKENKNILVDYSDFQCPACKTFHKILKSFEASTSPDFDITNKVTLVYRHFPLISIHQNSFTAAYAAEAAGLQNKFWEMADLLYEKQLEWSSLSNPKKYFLNLAKTLKLDIKKFSQDIESKIVKDKVQANLNEAESIGLNSTPTFFLNGKKVEVNTFDEFKNLLKSL